jgi:lysozyme family protein
MSFWSRIAAAFKRPAPVEAPAPVADRFAACIPIILRHEGGYVDHPRDPGGATNLGITHATLADWRGRPVTKADVRALTVDEAKQIYRAKYWRAIHGDDLPAGVDLAVFDFAVNSGPGRAIRFLQAAVGQGQDGILGPRTLAAVQHGSTAEIVDAICTRRVEWLRTLPGWVTFGGGWSRRVKETREEARRMALG